jgi:hypothetical protein
MPLMVSPGSPVSTGRSSFDGTRDRRRKLVLFGMGVILLGLSFKTIIRGDGIGYYAYLPSIVGQRTVDFQPTFERFLDAGVPAQAENLRIELDNGLTANYKQVGSALMALPFYALTTVLLGVTAATEDPVLSPVYQLAFTTASLAYVLVGLFLLYRFLKDLWGTWAARLALIAAVFATPLVAYMFFEPSYSHTFSVAAIIVFALFLYKTGPDRSGSQWLLLGLIGGVMVITHVQEILFMALIPAEAGWMLANRRWSTRLLSGYALAAAGFAVGILPQLLIDRLVFERWLPPSAPNISFDFVHPHLVELLTSTYHGWLSWSPLVVAAFLGFPILVRRLGWFAVALIGIGLGEFWLNAALSDWSGGLGFGSRRLTDQTLLLALGFGAFFSWLRLRSPKAVIALVAAGVGWTALLLAQFYYIIPPGVAPTWADFLAGQLHAVLYLPRLFIQGTVIRELATGQLIRGVLTGFLLTAVLGAAVLVSQRVWSRFSLPDR